MFPKFMKQVSSLFNSRTLSEPTSSPAAPYDIWREIVELLPPHALLNLCLVNKNFYLLTQPFIFEHTTIRPKGELKSLAINFKRTLQSLHSPSISSSIRHFHVDLSAFPNTKIRQSASDIVLSQFATIAPSFPNLRHFTFVSVYINLSVLTKLQKLAPFTLSLKSCIFASELTKTNLDIPISDLQFTDSSPFMEYAAPRRRYPELFLRTGHLKSIIAGREYAETALIEMADYTRPFAQLTHLEFPIESCASNHLIPVLSLCPSLEVLNLKARISSPLPLISDYNTPFPPSFLPNLKSFAGPLLLARRLFLPTRLPPGTSKSSSSSSSSSSPKRNLHSTTIYLSRSFSLHADDKISLGCAEGENIFNTINLLPPTATTLTFPALFLFGPDGLLPQIKNATTALKHLGINSDPRYYTRCFRPDQFIQRLTSSHTHFPKTLETLTIGIQIKDPFRFKRGGMKEFKSKQEAENVSQITFDLIPSLKTLKVWYWATPTPRWVTWVKQPNGNVDTYWQSP